ncbi:TetR/AcrR family transcriptional regulator, partial [Nocardia sp. CC201C]
MGRLTRAEQQEVTRRRVLDAAHREFTERGFRGATVDGIAERAGLTRGAVYSNFPGKRGLYFAVLAREAEQAAPPEGSPATTPAAALAAFASTWAERLPRSQGYAYTAPEQLTSPILSIDLIPEIQSDDRIRRPFAQLIELDAILLALALEALSAPSDLPLHRFLDVASSALTVLYGATQLSFAAPGFVDPSQIVALCEQLLRFHPDPEPAPRPYAETPPAHTVDEPWTPRTCFDMVHSVPIRLDGNRTIAILGMHRISAVRELLTTDPRPSP